MSLPTLPALPGSSPTAAASGLNPATKRKMIYALVALLLVVAFAAAVNGTSPSETEATIRTNVGQRFGGTGGARRSRASGARSGSAKPKAKTSPSPSSPSTSEALEDAG